MLVKETGKLPAAVEGFWPAGIHPQPSAIPSSARRSREEWHRLNTRPQPLLSSSAIPKHLKNGSGKPNFALLITPERELAEGQAARKISPETTPWRDMSRSLPDGFLWIPSNGPVAVGQHRLRAWHHRGSANCVWKGLAVDPVIVALDCSRPFASLLQLVSTHFTDARLIFPHRGLYRLISFRSRAKISLSCRSTR